MADHTTANVQFAPGFDDGACECNCGWEGRASKFGEHRKAVQAAKANTGTRAPEGYRVAANSWNGSLAPRRVQ